MVGDILFPTYFFFRHTPSDILLLTHPSPFSHIRVSLDKLIELGIQFNALEYEELGSKAFGRWG